jgi:hypothetical protein
VPGTNAEGRLAVGVAHEADRVGGWDWLTYRDQGPTEKAWRFVVKKEELEGR